MKNKLPILSVIALLSTVLLFIFIVYAWITLSNNTSVDGTDMKVIDSNSNNYIIEINGEYLESSDLSILPGQVKIYELTIEDLEGANLLISSGKISNNCYITATDNTIDYTSFDLNTYRTSDNKTIFYNSEGNIISELYNVYNGLYSNSNTPIHMITNGVNIINLHYPSDENIYNNSDYFLNDQIYDYSNKLDIFNEMVESSDIRNTLKYCIRTTSGLSINWADEKYFTDDINYRLNTPTLYLYLYFDPNVYTEVNDIELRNSNPFMFQSIRLNFTASRG